MSLARLPCRLFLKARAYVSQPLGHVLTNTHTHTRPFTCAQTIERKYLHTHLHVHAHICLHSHTSGFKASKQSHKALQHEHTHPCALLQYVNISTTDKHTHTHTSL